MITYNESFIKNVRHYRAIILAILTNHFLEVTKYLFTIFLSLGINQYNITRCTSLGAYHICIAETNPHNPPL